MRQIRWSAPEVLESKVFSSASDVWSFGIVNTWIHFETVCLFAQVLYEIAAKGEMPYASWSNARVWVQVQGGYILPKPERTNPELYQAMKSCWCKVRGSIPFLLVHFADVVFHRIDFQKFESLKLCRNPRTVQHSNH